MNPTRRFHVGLAYQSLDGLLGRMEDRGLPSIRPLLGAASADIRRRSLQRIAEVVFPDYLKFIASRTAAGGEPDLAGEECASFGGIQLDGKGGLSVERRTVLHGLARYVGHWAHMLVAIAMGALARKAPGPATLVFGVPVEAILQQGDDKQFRAYCGRGPIDPLVKARNLLVQVPGVPSGYPDKPPILYRRYPLHVLVARTQLGLLRRVWLLGQHVASFPVYLAAAARFPVLWLLGADFAQLTAARALEEAAAVEAVVLSSSHLATQPLWMRSKGLVVHMVWYSQNSIPLVYKWDGLVSRLPQHRLMYVDVHWTWTPGFAAYLQSVNPGSEAKVIGPILWQLREPVVRRNTDAITLAVFDVTPFKMDAAREMGIYEYYYRGSTMRAFMQGIIRVRTAMEGELGTPVRIRLKHKRQFSPLHDEDYVRWIAALEREGALERVPVDENLFTMIGASDAVFAPPYSSPVYIADALEVPALYYDPTRDLLPTCEPATHVQFAADEGELARAAIQAVREKRQAALRA